MINFEPTKSKPKPYKRGNPYGRAPWRFTINEECFLLALKTHPNTKDLSLRTIRDVFAGHFTHYKPPAISTLSYFYKRKHDFIISRCRSYHTPHHKNL